MAPFTITRPSLLRQRLTSSTWVSFWCGSTVRCSLFFYSTSCQRLFCWEPSFPAREGSRLCICISGLLKHPVVMRWSQWADKYLVQCKQWKSRSVGVVIVRELYGVMAAEGAVGGFVVASGDFTEEAKRFAEGRSIELLGTDTLLELVKVTGGEVPEFPLRSNNASKHACPQCSSPMVLRTARRGNHPGKRFWGCSRYPGCKGVREA